MKSTSAKNLSEIRDVIDSAPQSAVDDRLEHISTAAYHMAEARAFEPGLELDDWLRAEAEFDAMKGPGA